MFPFLWLVPLYLVARQQQKKREAAKQTGSTTSSTFAPYQSDIQPGLDAKMEDHIDIESLDAFYEARLEDSLA